MIIFSATSQGLPIELIRAGMRMKNFSADSTSIQLGRNLVELKRRVLTLSVTAISLFVHITRFLFSFWY